MSKFRGEQVLQALRKNNPEVRALMEERELAQAKLALARVEKRKRLKARAQRDRLVLRLAREPDSPHVSHWRKQVIELNQLLSEVPR